MFGAWEENHLIEKAIESRRRSFEIERRRRSENETYVPVIIIHTELDCGVYHSRSDQAIIQMKDDRSPESAVELAKARLSRFREACEMQGKHKVNKPSSTGFRMSF